MVTTSSALFAEVNDGLHKQARELKLVTNFNGTKLADMDTFLSTLNNGQEIKAYQHAFHASSTRKGLDGKSERFDLNPQGDLYALRRWMGMIREEANAVMLIHIDAVREAPLGVALALDKVLKIGKPVLCVGASAQMEHHLKAEIDLSLGKIDPVIKADNALRHSLSLRVTRGNSFFNTARRLIEIRFLPDHIRERLTNIGTSKGARHELTEAQVINLCLLSDLYSRYERMLRAFRQMARTGSRIRQLSSMFNLLMGNASVAEALPIFEGLIDPEEGDPKDIDNHEDLFGRLMQYVKSSEGIGRGLREEERLANLFSSIGEATLKLRALRDPALWRQVQFIHPTTEAERQLAAVWAPFLREASNLKNDANHKPEGAVIKEYVKALRATAQFANNMRTAVEGGQSLAIDLLGLLNSANLPTSSLQHVYEDHRELLEENQIGRLVARSHINAAQLNRHANQLQQRLNGVEEKAKYLGSYILNNLKRYEQRLAKVREGVFHWHMATGALYTTMHLEGSKLSRLERLCAVQLGRTRLGLGVQLKSDSWDSIEVMPGKTAPPIGKLQNDPALVAAVYTEFISQRVEHGVRKLVSSKLQHLQNFHGPWLMPWLHAEVTHTRGIPLSLGQMEWILHIRGVFSQHTMDGVDTAGGDSQGGKQEKSTAQRRKSKAKHAGAIYKTVAPDPFLVLEEDLEYVLLHNEEIVQKTQNMQKRLRKAAIKFKTLVDDLRTASESSARGLIWSFYKKGIYNLYHPWATQELRKTRYYGGIKEVIAQIIARKQRVFTYELERNGVQLLLPPELHYLLVIGSSYTFLSHDVIVRYQLQRSNAPMEELPKESQEFYKEFIHILDNDHSPLIGEINALGQCLTHCDIIWTEYSRCLLFSFIDTVITAVLETKLRPSHAQPKNLHSMNDSMLLCVGPSRTTTNALNFTKILSKPENMGSIDKNPSSCNVTMGEMVTETRLVGELEKEMEFMQILSEDVLHVCYSLSHLKQESDLVNEFERVLVELVHVLNTPIRLLTETHLQSISEHAQSLLDCAKDLRNVPENPEELLITRLENQLKSTRSDGLSVSLKNFEGLVLQREPTPQQEGAASYTTSIKSRTAPKDNFIFRLTKLLHLQSILRKKRVVVMSPEGHKQRQIEYAIDIIQSMQKLRGDKIEIFLDHGQLSTEQALHFSAWVKPANFFDMNRL